MFNNQQTKCRFWGATLLLSATLVTSAQAAQLDPFSYSVTTPHPINPAESTTNPSARATQTQNPFLGSVPATATGTAIRLSIRDAIERGLRYNLGLIESNQASADVRAGRLRSLAALLPQISADGRQAFENNSLKEIGLKLSPTPGFPGLPSTTGGFGYQDVRVSLTQSLYSAELRDQYKARKSAERASVFSIKDSRDVVVFAVGTAYAQAIASAARVETARAQLASAQELDRQIEDRFKSEVSPEIDGIRAQVERQSAEQRLTTAVNEFEKNKLTLARITGLAIDQDFILTDTLSDRPLAAITEQSATEDAFRSRSDLASAEASVRAAQFSLRAGKAERLPTVSIHANYGATGVNIGNFNQVYSIAGRVSVPLYTGGRIRADIQQAQADLARREAEYADLKGRIAYDVRVAWLDLGASDSSVKVARRNKALADRALAQSRDRYENGVTNYLEVVQAQEAVVAASENYIQSLYSFDVAKISLLRATGSSEMRLQELLGGK
jgi:outer membrane protein TolC